MTGAEHYAEAERLLIEPMPPRDGTPIFVPPVAERLACAQAHATLALAWATDREIARHASPIEIIPLKPKRRP